MLEFLKKYICFNEHKDKHLTDKVKDLKDLDKALDILTSDKTGFYLSPYLVTKMKTEFKK